MRSILSAVTAFLILGSTACCAAPPPPASSSSSAPAVPSAARPQSSAAESAEASPAPTIPKSKTENFQESAASASPAASSCPAFKVETLQTEQFTISYLKFGKPGGQPLVILPGLSVKSVMELADAIAEAYRIFADRYEIYLMDRRSDVPSVYSVRDMAKDTEAALDALKLSQCDIVGFSQGGMIAQVIAAERPDLAHKLVLGSTTAKVTDYERKLFLGWARLAAANDLDGLTRSLLTHIYSDDFCRQNEAAYSAYIHSASPEDLKRFIIFSKGMEDFDASGQLKDISCPVLVLGAKQDKIISPHASEDLQKKLRCQSYIYDGYGHAVYDEAPDYKDKVLNFLNEEKH
ncbi:MAG: alpha/beta hydrolase [bacterium]|nr:alpha/beta hydrolase [bacterium]